MKSPATSPTLLLTTCLLAGPLMAEISKAPNPAEGAANRGQVDSVYEVSTAKAVTKDVSVQQAKPSLLGESEFLVGAHGFAFVPRGAVVAQGKAVTVSKVAPAGEKLLQWSDFHRTHRGGLRFVAISESQWTGESSLEPLRSRLEAARKGSFTTLTTLDDEVVSLPELKSLLKADS